MDLPIRRWSWLTLDGPGLPIHRTGRDRRAGAANHELAHADHVHELNASEYVGGRAERHGAKHRPGQAFNRAMVLLDDVVEVLDLTYSDRCVFRRS